MRRADSRAQCRRCSRNRSALGGAWRRGLHLTQLSSFSSPSALLWTASSRAWHRPGWLLVVFIRTFTTRADRHCTQHTTRCFVSFLPVGGAMGCVPSREVRCSRRSTWARSRGSSQREQQQQTRCREACLLRARWQRLPSRRPGGGWMRLNRRRRRGSRPSRGWRSTVQAGSRTLSCLRLGTDSGVTSALTCKTSPRPRPSSMK